MSDGETNVRLETRPLTLFAVAVSGIFACAVLGGLTNSVNGWVSPEYFVTVMRWHGVDDVWRASIAQGIFEGLLFGFFFSLVFTIGMGIITGSACTYGFALRHLSGIVAGALVFWLMGGVAGMMLAMLSPEFYRRRAFLGVPGAFGPMLAFAWVGGSIWGVQLGGLVSVALGLVVLRANWRRRLEVRKAAPELDTLDVKAPAGVSTDIQASKDRGGW